MLTPDSAFVRVKVFEVFSTLSTGFIAPSWGWVTSWPRLLVELPELLELVERVLRLTPGRVVADGVADVVLGQDLGRLEPRLVLVDRHTEGVAEHRVHHHVGRVDGIEPGPRRVPA